MKQPFFETAINAAYESPKAFAAIFTFAGIFKKKGANPNVREYKDEKPGGLGEYGYSLIHVIIKDIADEKLPPLLAILVQYGADLEITESCDETPLTTAAIFQKKEAVKFLLEHKVEINNPKSLPLCNTMFIPGDESIRLDIVKLLVNHGADINRRDQHMRFPLMEAVKERRLDVISYLIFKGADIFLSFYNETVFNDAYPDYIKYGAEFNTKEPDHFDIRMRMRILEPFTVIIDAAKDRLYRRALFCTGNEDEIKVYLDDDIKCLAGQAENTAELVKFLEKEVLMPVLAKIKKTREEQLEHAFRIGSLLSKKQQAANHPVPAIYRFFQKQNGIDLVPMIFSYVHKR